MSRLLLLASALLGWAPPSARAEILEEVNKLELSGRFKEAAEALTNELNSKTLSTSDRKHLEFELDRLARIKQDFPYTQEGLFEELQRAVKDLSRAEYERWISEGRFDSRVIDGQRFFMISSVSNLYFRYPELNPRRLPPKDMLEHSKASWETCMAIKRAALAEKKPYVLPKRFHVTMTVTAKPGAAPAGDVIRAWLPIPREYPFQNDFQLLEGSSPFKHIDAADSPIRAVYLEQPAQSNQPTEFRIEYDYTMRGVYFEVKPGDVRPCPDDSALKEFTREAPHVVFTPEIRALSDRIGGQEPNPYLKAKKFFDWIADEIKYSYAIEYSTIRNISDYCRSKGYGDCGQEALLFMTLCRYNGIPARWQTGWNTFPGAKTIHDWCEIYIAPYGWMPVDPYKGIFAMRYATGLTPQQKREVRDFYFGGLDYYRMAANADHNQPLTPAKKTLRSDDVDFQRGELESGTRNIYFDQYSWALNWKELDQKVQ